MNFLQHLRETARVCPRPLLAKQVRDAADDLDIALSTLTRDPTTENLQRVNGRWAYAVRMLDAVPPFGGDGTQVGAMPVPRMKQAA